MFGIWWGLSCCWWCWWLLWRIWFCGCPLSFIASDAVRVTYIVGAPRCSRNFFIWRRVGWRCFWELTSVFLQINHSEYRAADKLRHNITRLPSAFLLRLKCPVVVHLWAGILFQQYLGDSFVCFRIGSISPQGIRLLNDRNTVDWCIYITWLSLVSMKRWISL